MFLEAFWLAEGCVCGAEEVTRNTRTCRTVVIATLTPKARRKRKKQRLCTGCSSYYVWRRISAGLLGVGRRDIFSLDAIFFLTLASIQPHLHYYTLYTRVHSEESSHCQPWGTAQWIHPFVASCTKPTTTTSYIELTHHTSCYRTLLMISMELVNRKNTIRDTRAT